MCCFQKQTTCTKNNVNNELDNISRISVNNGFTVKHINKIIVVNANDKKP